MEKPQFKVGDKIVVTKPYKGFLYTLHIGDTGIITQITPNNNSLGDYLAVRFDKYITEDLSMYEEEIRLATPLDKLL